MWALVAAAFMGILVAGIGVILVLVPYHETINERLISEETRLDAALRGRMERTLYLVGLALLMFGLVVTGVMIHASVTESW